MGNIIEKIWPNAFSMGSRKIKTCASCVSICYEYFSFTGDSSWMNSSGLLEKGWYQYDTPQKRYSVDWVNPELKVLLTYAEGSIYWLVCPNTMALNAHLKGLSWPDNI